MPRQTTRLFPAENTTALAVYVTISQAAAALAVDPKTIRRYIADGSIPAVRLGSRVPGSIRDTRAIRIPAAAIEQALHPVAAGGDVRW